MKNLLCLLLFISFSSYGQWGLTGSFNYGQGNSEGQGSSDESFDGDLGLSIGGFYDVKINDRFTFRGKLRSVFYQATAQTTSNTIDLNARYLMINPEVHFKASNNFILIGGLLMGVAPKLEGEYSTNSVKFTINYDDLPDSKVNTLFMAVLGVGYDLGKVQLNLTLEKGLNPAYESTNSDYKVGLTAINFGVDYKF